MFATWDPTDSVPSEERDTETPARGLAAVLFALIALLGTVAFVAIGAGGWPGWMTAAVAVLWVGALTLIGDLVERTAGGPAD